MVIGLSSCVEDPEPILVALVEDHKQYYPNFVKSPHGRVPNLLITCGTSTDARG